jgi:aryl-alcohol dehydrogenase-like predicted oxidoreductase
MGLGCMGMSEFYGTGDEAESIATIRAALDAGVDFLDTADMYGPFTNEGWWAGPSPGGARRSCWPPSSVTSATPTAAGSGVNGRPEYVRKAADASFERLGVDHIDLYYQHRVDPTVPIEDTWAAMATWSRRARCATWASPRPPPRRSAGRTPPTRSRRCRRSGRCGPARSRATGCWPRCGGWGSGFVAYSRSAAGSSPGTIRSLEDLAPDDFRRHNPRFQGDNLVKNLELVDKVTRTGTSARRQPAQVALAWVLAQGDDVVPIPGTKRRTYLMENLDAVHLKLSNDELRALDEAAPRGSTAGDRYADMSTVRR